LAVLLLAAADATDATLRRALEARDAAVTRHAGPGELDQAGVAVTRALELKRQVHSLGFSMGPDTVVDQFVVRHAALLGQLSVDLSCCSTVRAILELHGPGPEAGPAEAPEAAGRVGKSWAAAGLSLLALAACVGCVRRFCGAAAAEEAVDALRNVRGARARKGRRQYTGGSARCARRLEDAEADEAGGDDDDDDDDVDEAAERAPRQHRGRQRNGNGA